VFIGLEHLYLIIFGECIHEAQTFKPNYGIDQLVNAWQGERILRASLIEIGVVNTHAPSVIGLLYQDYIRNLFRTFYFLDEPCL
jgi:hypothetical protein